MKTLPLLGRMVRWARKTEPGRASPDRTPMFGRRPRSGIPYSIDVAMTYSTVFACVRLISETVGQLSWHEFARIANGGRRKAEDSPVDFLIHTQPNPEMTSMTFRETLQSHALMWGDGFAEIERNGLSGRPVALWPLPPDRTWAKRLDSGELVYRTSSEGGAEVTLPASDVFHLHGLSFNGLKGYSIIELAREGVGLALAAEYFGANFFGRGVRPTGYVEHPAKLTDKAFEKVRDSIREQGGIDNTLHPLVLDGGWKWVNLGIPPNDAQFLETREFQVLEIARWFRVPPHKLAHLKDSAVRANIESENISFVTDSIQPWVTRWEQEADRKLLAGPQRRRRFTKMNLGTLLRGDTKTRMEAYKIAREIGLQNPDEQRALEDMNPIGGVHGSQYIVPLNFTTAEGLAAKAEAEATKAKQLTEPPPVVVPNPTEPTNPDGGDRDASDDAENASRVAIGQRGPVKSIMWRAVNRECKAIKAKLAHRGPESAGSENGAGSFRKWLETWFDSHVESLVGEFARVMASAVEACGGGAAEGNGRSTMQASLALGAYSADSVTEIMEAVSHGNVTGMLDRRKREVPDAMADQIADAARTVGLLTIMKEKSCQLQKAN